MTLLTLWLTTLAYCLAGSVIPVLNTEVYLISVSAMSPPTFVGPLVVAATLGQMVGKVAMFYGGRGVLRLRNERIREGVGKLRARLEARPVFAHGILFCSATVGLPPLYVMSIACGTIGMGVISFTLIGTVGRLIHFAVVAWAPQLVRAWVG